MSQRADHFKLGLFVLVGLALGLAGVLALGASEFLRRPLRVVTYMDESVKGLEVGSLVRYRGVPRGKVVGIQSASAALNMQPDNRVFFTQGQYVEVLLEFDSPEFEGKSPADLRPVLTQLVEQGMRVQLSMNPLTGRADVEIDHFEAKKYPPVELNWVPEELYIPWARGTFSQVKSAAERILDRLESEEGLFAQAGRTLRGIESALENTRLEKIQAEVLDVLKTLDSKLEQVAVDEIVTDLRGTIEQIDQSVVNLDLAIQQTLETYRMTAEGVDEIVQGEAVQKITQRLDEISAYLADATAQVPGTVATVDRLVRRLDEMLAGRSSDVQAIVENLRRATGDLKEIARNGRLYPSWILFGAPPTPTEIDK